jgi:probable HAF family extracellular repeat protein
MTDLNSLLPANSGWVLSDARGINDSGQIAGTGLINGRDHAFLYSGGRVTDLGTLNGFTESTASAINASGQVVGYATKADRNTYHAFLYPDSAGKMTDLGTLNGFTSSIATGINASGQVGGFATKADGNTNHAFLYPDSTGKMTDLGTFGESNSAASGPNATGQVAVIAYTYFTSHSFLYSGGSVTDLGTLGGTGGTDASGINASGQVVGISYTASNDEHAFLYSGSGMTDLNSLLPSNSGWVLTSGSAINDSGQIVGHGTINGQMHGFLLTLSQIGVDISNVPNWTQLSAAYDLQFVIAASFGGVNTYPAQAILSSATPLGLQKAAYFALNPNQNSSFGTPAQQFAIAKAQIGSEFANVRFIALDVEQVDGVTYPHDPVSVTGRIEWIEQGLDAIQSAGKNAVIYTRQTDWDEITGIGQGTGTGTTSFGCLPLWNIQYDEVPSLSAFTGFGSWQSRAGKQYDYNLSLPNDTSGVHYDPDVFDPSVFSSTARTKAIDKTSAVGVTRSGFRLNHTTNQYVQTVTITNTSTAIIPGPLSLALDTLSANATLVNINGITSCTVFAGSPFINVSLSATGILAPGQSVTATLQFSNPTNQGITYIPRVLAGSGTR